MGFATPRTRERAMPAGTARLALCALLLIELLAAAAARGASVVDPGQGHVDIPPGATGAAELSGLAFAGGDRYYAVSDNGGRLFPLQIRVDPASGFVTAAVPGAPLRLPGAVDLEGVAVADGDGILVSDERGPAIREHRLSDGVQLGIVAVPPIYRKSRNNRSLESLSRAGDALWTANEEALAVDGPLSNATSGTRVRLQRFDAARNPAGQWAYVTDPYPGAPFLGLQVSGVADLLALANGELLVLERSFSDQGFRTRIYQVDFSGATDTSALTSLARQPFTPVAKRLLWDSGATAANYEGIALGRELAAGDWSLLLLADDGSVGVPGVYPLRLRLTPAPSAESTPPPRGSP